MDEQNMVSTKLSQSGTHENIPTVEKEPVRREKPKPSEQLALEPGTKAFDTI